MRSLCVRKGARAEQDAARWLAHQGARILARNVRCARGELDLIALWDGVLVFVEVKARKHEEQGFWAVDARKRARIESAAAVWLAEHPDLARLPCRFDVLVVSYGRFGRARIAHLADAWRTGG